MNDLAARSVAPYRPRRALRVGWVLMGVQRGAKNIHSDEELIPRALIPPFLVLLSPEDSEGVAATGGLI